MILFFFLFFSVAVDREIQHQCAASVQDLQLQIIHLLWPLRIHAVWSVPARSQVWRWGIVSVCVSICIYVAWSVPTRSRVLRWEIVSVSVSVSMLVSVSLSVFFVLLWQGLVCEGEELCVCVYIFSVSVLSALLWQALICEGEELCLVLSLLHMYLYIWQERFAFWLN